MKTYWKSLSAYRQNEQCKGGISSQCAKDGFGNKWCWHSYHMEERPILHTRLNKGGSTVTERGKQMNTTE